MLKKLSLRSHPVYWMNSYVTEIRKLLRFGRSITFAVLDSVVKLVVKRKKRNIAIIVRLDAIGDFFIWMQSGAVDLTAFAKKNGNAAILLANSSWSDYAQYLGLWDQVIAINTRKFTRNPWYRLRVM